MATGSHTGEGDGSTINMDSPDRKSFIENGTLDLDYKKNIVNYNQNSTCFTNPENGKDAICSPEPSQLSLPSPENANSIEISKTIYRLGHTDTFACKNCKQRGDRWFMQIHHCKGLSR
jgi:hypothetical protein